MDWFVGDGIIDTLINEDFYTGGGGIGLVKDAGAFTILNNPTDPSTTSGQGLGAQFESRASAGASAAASGDSWGGLQWRVRAFAGASGGVSRAVLK